MHLKIDTTGKTSICIGDSVKGKILLQQMAWGQWNVIDSISKNKKDNDTCYSRQVALQATRNAFRLSLVSGRDTFSAPQVMVSKKTGIDSCFYNSCIYCKDVINFDCEEEWRIYDQYGHLMEMGKGKTADSSRLPDGQYYLMTAYFTYEFSKQ